LVIHLIRHGSTYANENKLFCGKTDLPLSEFGEKQIAQNITNCIYPDADFVISSSRARAIQTASLIYPDIKPVLIDDLDECNFGEFEMKTYEQVKDLDECIRWVNDTTGDVKCPDGESQNEFKLRVLQGFSYGIELIRAQSIKSAAVIIHGGSIVHIMQSLFDETQDDPAIQPDNGCGYTIILSENGDYSYKTI